MRYLKDVTTLDLMVERCIGCGMCAAVCPHGVMAVTDGLARIADRDACMECGACARNCPTDAINVQAGVGCAQALINSALGRSGDSCCSVQDHGPAAASCGADGAGGRQEPPGKPGGSGCC